jgi:hypothetical protein
MSYHNVKSVQKDRRAKTDQSVHHALTAMTNSHAKIEMILWNALSCHARSVLKDRRAKTAQSVRHVRNSMIII